MIKIFIVVIVAITAMLTIFIHFNNTSQLGQLDLNCYSNCLISNGYGKIDEYGRLYYLSSNESIVDIQREACLNKCN